MMKFLLIQAAVALFSATNAFATDPSPSPSPSAHVSNATSAVIDGIAFDNSSQEPAAIYRIMTACRSVATNPGLAQYAPQCMANAQYQINQLAQRDQADAAQIQSAFNTLKANIDAPRATYVKDLTALSTKLAAASQVASPVTKAPSLTTLDQVNFDYAADLAKNSRRMTAAYNALYANWNPSTFAAWAKAEKASNALRDQVWAADQPALDQMRKSGSAKQAQLADLLTTIHDKQVKWTTYVDKMRAQENQAKLSGNDTLFKALETQLNQALSVHQAAMSKLAKQAADLKHDIQVECTAPGGACVAPSPSPSPSASSAQSAVGMVGIPAQSGVNTDQPASTDPSAPATVRVNGAM